MDCVAAFPMDVMMFAAFIPAAQAEACSIVIAVIARFCVASFTWTRGTNSMCPGACGWSGVKPTTCAPENRMSAGSVPRMILQNTHFSGATTQRLPITTHRQLIQMSMGAVVDSAGNWIRWPPTMNGRERATVCPSASRWVGRTFGSWRHTHAFLL